MDSYGCRARVAWTAWRGWCVPAAKTCHFRPDAPGEEFLYAATFACMSGFHMRCFARLYCAPTRLRELLRSAAHVQQQVFTNDQFIRKEHHAFDGARGGRLRGAAHSGWNRCGTGCCQAVGRSTRDRAGAEGAQHHQGVHRPAGGGEDGLVPERGERGEPEPARTAAPLHRSLRRDVAAAGQAAHPEPGRRTADRVVLRRQVARGLLAEAELHRTNGCATDDRRCARSGVHQGADLLSCSWTCWPRTPTRISRRD